MNKSQLKPIETIQEDEFLEYENQQQTGNKHAKNDKKTGAKGAKRAISIILAISLAAGSVYAYKEIKKKIEQSAAEDRATSIVATYKVGDVCSLDETIYSSKNYDTKICDGQTLVSTLNQNGIKYCEILDEYYTKDGRNIALVQVEVEKTERISPEALIDESNGVTYYTLPEGYEYVNGYGQKVTTEVKTVVTDVRNDGQYNNLSLPGVTVKRVLSVEVVGTKSYDEIISSDFVCDVKDDYAEHLNGRLSEATYRLIPKSN